jgi:hypothetical protein
MSTPPPQWKQTVYPLVFPFAPDKIWGVAFFRHFLDEGTCHCYFGFITAFGAFTNLSNFFSAIFNFLVLSTQVLHPCFPSLSRQVRGKNNIFKPWHSVSDKRNLDYIITEMAGIPHLGKWHEGGFFDFSQCNKNWLIT